MWKEAMTFWNDGGTATWVDATNLNTTFDNTDNWVAKFGTHRPAQQMDYFRGIGHLQLGWISRHPLGLPQTIGHHQASQAFRMSFILEI